LNYYLRKTSNRAIANPVAAPNSASGGKCAPVVSREKLIAAATP
jgi:hypothetical protein